MRTQTGRVLRLTAVTATVVMALTGFSDASHKTRHGYDGGGGGCSSSSQDHDGSSTSTTGGGGSSGSSSGSTADSAQKAALSTPVIVVRCASPGDPYATVEVQNPNDREVTFMAYVTFLSEQGIPLVERFAPITAPAYGAGTAQIAVGDQALAEQVSHCQATRQAEPIE